MKCITGFIVALGVDETLLDGGSHSLRFVENVSKIQRGEIQLKDVFESNVNIVLSGWQVFNMK